MSLVEYEVEGTLAIVSINRPESRNAVDRATADELAQAFRRFDSDPALSVAILTGKSGCFCAGADLKAVSSNRGNRVTETGAGPLGCTRMLLNKPVIAAVEGYAVAGIGARAVVRPASGGARCGIWRVLPALGSAPGRWRHGTVAAPHRDEPRLHERARTHWLHDLPRLPNTVLRKRACTAATAW